MKEIVIISGKGGTGKTSLTACYAALAGEKVLADCDVDAADLHLMLNPRDTVGEPFFGGKRAEIRADDCLGCGECERLCRYEAIVPDGDAYRVDPKACEGCGVCAWFCPNEAIDFELALNGECLVSQTDFGTLVHARLGVAEENSGKLVTTVRNRAKAIAEEQGKDLVIVDGSPGVGCPVIASVAGVDLAVIVTEPTLSGRHDLQRVLELLKHFGIPAAVLLNKSDINRELSEGIATECAAVGVPIVGRIAYSTKMVKAVIAGRPFVEISDGPVAAAVRASWDRIREQAGLTVETI